MGWDYSRKSVGQGCSVSANGLTGLPGRIGWLGRRRGILWRLRYLRFDTCVRIYHCSALGCSNYRLVQGGGYGIASSEQHRKTTRER